MPKYNYVASSQKATATYHSVKGNFISAEEENLILGKDARLEISAIKNDQLEPRLEFKIFGGIEFMCLIRQQGIQTDRLFICTKRNQFAILSFDQKTQTIITNASGDLELRARNTDAKIGAVDSKSSLVLLHLYSAIFQVLPCGLNGYVDNFNVRVDEQNVSQIVFLDGPPSRPTIAILFQGEMETKRLKTYALDVKEQCLTPGPLFTSSSSSSSSSSSLSSTSSSTSLKQNTAHSSILVEDGAFFLIPVALPYGGVLVVGEESVTYYSTTQAPIAVTMPFTEVTAWGRVDASRYLLGDFRGSLSILVLDCDDSSHPHRVRGLHLEPLGQVGVPNTLTYLDSGCVYVGSCVGDSSLVRLGSRRQPNGSYLEQLDDFPSLGPILDLCVVPGTQDDAAHVVTCSGFYSDGSLRVLRSGVGLQEEAAVTVQGIKNMWALRHDSSQTQDSFLIQSFARETRVLAVQGHGRALAETTWEGLDASSRSLWVGNLQDDLWLQVTPTHARLLKGGQGRDVGQLVQEWSLEDPSDISERKERITACTANTTQILLATSRQHLILLTLDSQNRSLIESSRMDLEHEVSCVALCPSEGGQTASAWAVLGQWGDHKVRVLALPSLQEVSSMAPAGPDGLPRSLALAHMGSELRLACGLGDGSVSIVNFDRENGALTAPQRIVLGRLPASLGVLQSQGTSVLLACGDRPSLLFASDHSAHILCSSINLPPARCACAFTPRGHLGPELVAIASNNGLALGSVDRLQKTHIETVPLGNERPRRIAYQSSSNTFGLCTVRTEEEGFSCPSSEGSLLPQPFDLFSDVNMEAAQGPEDNVGEAHCVRLLDANSMQVLDSVRLAREHEHCSAIASVILSSGASTHPLSSSSSSSSSSTYGSPPSSPASRSTPSVSAFVVGTALALPDEEEPTEGRLMAFTVVNKALIKLGEADVGGAVYCLHPFGGKLLAAVNNRVCVYAWDPRNRTFQLECAYHANFVATALRSNGNHVIYGDLMRSVSVLLYRPRSENLPANLEEVARDFDSKWVTALEVLDDHVMLGADEDSNLFSLRRNTEASDPEDRARLVPCGRFHLGSKVNAFQAGSLVRTSSSDSDRASPAPSHVFGTVSGMLGVVVPLTQEQYRFFVKIENLLTEQYHRSIGDLPYKTWRAFRTSTPGSVAQSKRNFIDGDTVEMVLELPKEHIQAMARELGVTVGELVRRVEEMARTH